MHTTNYVSEHVLQCASWYPVHSALNVGLKLLQCMCVDDLSTQYPWDAPIKRNLGGLSPGIVKATVSLKWGVQEAQIPSKPWVSWLYEHSVCFNTYLLLTPWRYSSCRTLVASHILCEVSWQQFFTEWSLQPHAQPPTWRTRLSLLVWHPPRNLSGMGGPTSSYAAAGVTFEFIVAHKPPSSNKVLLTRWRYHREGYVSIT
jgi:hypothetical protein